MCSNYFVQIMLLTQSNVAIGAGDTIKETNLTQSSNPARTKKTIWIGLLEPEIQACWMEQPESWRWV